MEALLSSSFSSGHALLTGIGDWWVVLPRPESCVESDWVDGDDADVTDTNDTGDSERDAELAVSVAMGEAFRGAAIHPEPCSADTCDEQMLATVVTKSDVADTAAVLS